MVLLPALLVALGREWAEAALKRGDKVAATARDTKSLSTLVETYGDSVLPLQLDVTDRAADFAAIKQAHERFGRLDIVVNNAGYGLFGTVENISEEQARAQVARPLYEQRLKTWEQWSEVSQEAQGNA